MEQTVVWVPVTDKLPELTEATPSTAVVVRFQDGQFALCTWSFNPYGRTDRAKMPRWKREGRTELGTVTHWMLLPQPDLSV